jgi:hypothetical protein
MSMMSVALRFVFSFSQARESWMISWTAGYYRQFEEHVGIDDNNLQH